MSAMSDFYRDVYHGQAFDDIDVLLQRAEDMVLNTISSAPVGQVQTGLYDMAVCAQAEAMGLSGGAHAWAAERSGGGFTIGAFSVSSGSSAASVSGVALDGMALGYLERAGLLYRGVGVLEPAMM